jgi:hypothetical protein
MPLVKDRKVPVQISTDFAENGYTRVVVRVPSADYSIVGIMNPYQVIAFIHDAVLLIQALDEFVEHPHEKHRT